ncbi:NADP oxidoreductase [Burkholderia sp. WAC0059]|uniref:NADPH-dependent F420 reductase n=1 Tax=Burkholderia sp. WAC0059 TaxID=2066022 RepID=UPI000C7F0BC0|nr:NADPH-dependent F420 reductase [Burkholderia sp. WAC0059]PLZ00719.1 NADP oxidoreductase [Burkholderia sp. WAC0059]
MRIGTIGAGQIAQSFARKAVDAGHNIVFSNSQGPDSLVSMVAEFGPLAMAGTIQDALNSPVVLLAVPWPKVEAILQALPAWHGQILIDPTNAFHGGNPSGGLVDFHGSSSSERVAALAPGARVVKALNTIFMTNFAKAPVSGGLRRVAFLSGDDQEARETVAGLLQSFGFAPVDLGLLQVGGRIQGVGAPIAGHDFFLPWPAPRSFPAFNGERQGATR